MRRLKSYEPSPEDFESNDMEEDELAYAKANAISMEYHRNKANPFSYCGQEPPSREMLYFSHDLPEEEEAYIIRHEAPKKIPNDSSLATAIFKILLANKDSLHISDIICVLKRKRKLSSKSFLHHYSIVYKNLIRNNHLFRRIDKGFFALRSGIIGECEKLNKKQQIYEQESCTTVVSMVEEALNNAAKNGKATASQIFIFLKRIGFKGNFNQVSTVLRDRRFKKFKGQFSMR